MNPVSRHLARWLPALAGVFTTLAATAQVLPPPQNVVTLSAQASVDVTQDWLSITLAATREGGDAAQLQSQLRQLLDAALVEARKAARPGQVDVRTGQFSIFPRYAPKGGITGWQGSAELVIEGKDIGAISQLAGRLQGLAVTRVVQALSREAREHVEAEVAAQAIARFKSRAEAYAKQFGFAGYAIREVSVNTGDVPPVAVPLNRLRTMAAVVPMGEDSQPIEVGKTLVSVSVNGSIQMSPR